jgi:hypothetical protein
LLGIGLLLTGENDLLLIVNPGLKLVLFFLKAIVDLLRSGTEAKGNFPLGLGRNKLASATERMLKLKRAEHIIYKIRLFLSFILRIPKFAPYLCQYTLSVRDCARRNKEMSAFIYYERKATKLVFVYGYINTLFPLSY